MREHGVIKLYILVAAALQFHPTARLMLIKDLPAAKETPLFNS